VNFESRSKLKLEINMHKAELLNKKVNIVYKISIILLIGLLATFIGKYDYMLSETSDMKKRIYKKFDHDLAVDQKAIDTDKDKKHYNHNMNFLHDTIDDRNKYIDGVNILENKLKENKNLIQYQLMFALFLSITYLIYAFSKISKIQEQISFIERELARPKSKKV